MSANTIAFIGTGVMGGAIAAGIAKTSTQFNHFVLCDPTPASADKVAKRIEEAAQSRSSSSIKITKSTDNTTAATAGLIVLAVKPQYAAAVLRQLGPMLNKNHLLLSIMAGVTIATIRGHISHGGGQSHGHQPRIIRSMPSTPMLVLLGAVVVAPDPASATKEDCQLVTTLFNALGTSAQMAEAQMNSVIGVCGSAPAFVALFIDALADGGVQCGLPRDMANKLAAQSVYGTGAMLTKGVAPHPAILRDWVCSPGGTSIAGVAALEDGNFRAAVMKAVVRAMERSAELSKL